MNKELVLKDMGFDALLMALKQGKIDLILAGMSITPSRLKQIEMVHYHGDNLKILPFVFWNKVPEFVKSVFDLKGETVCAQAGTIHEDCLLKFDFIKAKTLDTVVGLIMDIKYGKSIAAVLEPAVACVLQKKHPELKVFNVELSESNKGHGVGICKENKTLTASIEEAVKELKADGKIKELEKKWFK